MGFIIDMIEVERESWLLTQDGGTKTKLLIFSSYLKYLRSWASVKLSLMILLGTGFSQATTISDRSLVVNTEYFLSFWTYPLFVWILDAIDLVIDLLKLLSRDVDDFLIVSFDVVLTEA